MRLPVWKEIWQLFKEMPQAILDKRLYLPSRSWRSFFFYFSIAYLIFFPSFIFVYFADSWFLALLFTISILVYVAYSSLSAKNFRKKEIEGIPLYISMLFFIMSLLGFGFYLSSPYEISIAGLSTNFLLFGLSSLALFVCAFIMGLSGQRFHLRKSIGLYDNLIDKQKELWVQQLQGFPNANNIIKELEPGRRIAYLFDRGSFDLAILWSCNIIECVLTSTIREIGKVDVTKQKLFKTADGKYKSPHNKLKTLNYTHKHRPCRKTEEITTKILWKDLRNPIAHENKTVTFEETYGALMIFVSFLEEYPRTLITWQKMNLQTINTPDYLDHV